MSRGPRVAPLLALALGGCGLEEWRNADLQVDVRGAELGLHPDEARVRICVDGVGDMEEARGAGRLGFPGLPAGQPLVVTVDTLSDEDELRGGRAGPVTLGEDQPYADLDWELCQGADCAACQAEGELAATDEADWLLAVNMVE